MREIRMVLSLGQRWALLVPGAVITAVGIALIAVDVSPFGLGAGPVLLFMGFYSARFATVLTPHGLTLKAFTTRHFAWGEIAAVEAKHTLGTWYVRLTLTSGRRVRVRVPLDGPGQRDPDFHAKVATIWHWREAGVAAARQAYLQAYPQQPTPPQPYA
ncbi:hypothetical protein [Yinghuangia aomiensis]